ncbi:MAG: hypothetical protein U1A78_08810 [Polyangia bacterium]
MNKPSNAFAKVRSPLPGEAPAVPEHAPPAGLVTDGPTGGSGAVAGAASGTAAEPVAAWSASRAPRHAAGHTAEHAAAPTPHGADGADETGELADEQSLAYSADEAAWLFGLERVAPTPAPRTPSAVGAGGGHAAGSEPSQVTPLAPPSPGPAELSSARPAGLQTDLATDVATDLALAEPDVATPALAPPAEEPGTILESSRTDALTAEVTAALLPALEPGPPAPPTGTPLDDGQALPLAARQTLHLHSLAATTPRVAEVVSLEQQVTPPRGTAAYVSVSVPGPGPGPVTGQAGQPGVGETTASLLLPAPPHKTLTRASVSPTGASGTEGSLLRHAAGSLLTNLGMGLLGGLLALGGAAAVLSLRGERSVTPQAAPQVVSEPAPGLDAATRTRLLQQVTQALVSGRRPVALALLREYAAASPEPAVEELIRILEREPR